MTSEIDLSQFWCWNEECPDYGKQGNENIVIKQRYGKDNRALLKCRTCKDYFRETRGTVFFGLFTDHIWNLGELLRFRAPVK